MPKNENCNILKLKNIMKCKDRWNIILCQILSRLGLFIK